MPQKARHVHVGTPASDRRPAPVVDNVAVGIRVDTLDERGKPVVIWLDPSLARKWADAWDAAFAEALKTATLNWPPE